MFRRRNFRRYERRRVEEERDTLGSKYLKREDGKAEHRTRDR
jgi:hypothetical protein